LALLVCACWFPKDRGQRLEERVERVEGESAVRPPSENRGVAEEQVRRVDAKVDAKMAEVQGKLNELNAAAQKAGTERSARNDKVAEEVSRLRAMLEGYAHRLDAVEKSVAQLHASAGAGARAAERKSAAAVAPEASKAVAPEVSEKRGAPEAPQGGKGVLALARQQEVNGEKTVARDLYQEYVNKFTADPSAAQAHFRLGELAFGDRRYQDAIVEYGKVAKDFPRSNEAPDALLRTAESMMKIDLKDDAVAVLSEIPKRYPASSAATRAKQRIAELADGRRRRTRSAGD
jgi:tol-pal system protein YbgF